MSFTRLLPAGLDAPATADREFGSRPDWGPRPELTSAAVLLPFLVLAVRALVWAPRGALSGDDALIDLQAHQALHWRLLLGPYDRFGWHQPGPAYLYAVSLAERVTGAHLAAQALVATAALIDGISAAGVVLVVGHVWGRRPALGAATALAAVAALAGAPVLDDPWNPNVVILPLLLVLTLAAAATAGSPAALAGGLLVGSAVVQTYVPTSPVVAPVLLVGAAGLMWRLRCLRRLRAGGTDRFTRRRLAGPLALAGVTLLLWVPVVVQQLTGRPGNLALLWRFAVSHRAGQDPLYAVSVLGTAGSAVFGLPTPALAFDTTPGLVRFWVVVALVVIVSAAAVRSKSRAAAAGLIAAAGLAAAVLAAIQVPGMLWEYLLAWAAAPVVLALIVLAVMVAEYTGRNALPAVTALAAVVGLTVVASCVAPAATTSRDVSMATRAVLSHRDGDGPVGLVADDWDHLGVASGVADQLVLRGIPYTVPRANRFQYPLSSAARPSEWVLIAGPGRTVPSGYATVASTSRTVVSIGYRPPPGW